MSPYSLARLTLQGELVRLWHRSGFTALFVTHDVEEALLLASRVIVLSDRPARIKAGFDVAVPFRGIAMTEICALAHALCRSEHPLDIRNYSSVGVWLGFFVLCAGLAMDGGYRRRTRAAKSYPAIFGSEDTFRAAQELDAGAAWSGFDTRRT